MKNKGKDVSLRRSSVSRERETSTTYNIKLYIRESECRSEADYRSLNDLSNLFIRERLPDTTAEPR